MVTIAILKESARIEFLPGQKSMFHSTNILNSSIPIVMLHRTNSMRMNSIPRQHLQQATQSIEIRIMAFVLF
jgi:hypothetical protein